MPKALDLAGQKFGKLTVLERIGKNDRGHYVWRCRCDCGNYVDAVGYAVKNGSWASCGKCGKRPVERSVDIAGQVVGDYMAVERIGTYGTSAKWKCVCTTCGSEKEQGAYQFRIGKRASCPVCTAGMKRGEVIARMARIKREQSCKQEAPVPVKPKKRPTMEEINEAARAQHMTYGKYMAAYEGYIARHGELPELEG